METIRVDVLFGEPVYKKCMIACFMAFHQRLGEASRLSCLAILDEDIHKFIIAEALRSRRLIAPIGVAIDGGGGIWVSEMHEQSKFMLPALPALASELAVTLPDEVFERIAQESVSRVLDDLAESVARGNGVQSSAATSRIARHRDGQTVPVPTAPRLEFKYFARGRGRVRVFKGGLLEDVPAEFAKPFFLATNTANTTLAYEVFCANTAGNSILVLSASTSHFGHVVRRITHPRSAGNTGLAPRGLAIDPRTGWIFISCTNSHRIHVMRQNAGRMLNILVRTIGCRGRGDGQFQYPLGVCLSHGLLFVADSGNSRVQVLTTLGEFQNCIGHGAGSTGGQLCGPTGVAVSRNGIIFGNHRVLGFNWDGQVIWDSSSETYSGRLGHPLDLQNPCGLAIDHQSHLVVADHGNNAVLRIEIASLGALQSPVDADAGASPSRQSDTLHQEREDIEASRSTQQAPQRGAYILQTGSMNVV